MRLVDYLHVVIYNVQSHFNERQMKKMFDLFGMSLVEKENFETQHQKLNG